jgi:hypothetical protein
MPKEGRKEGRAEKGEGIEDFGNIQMQHFKTLLSWIRMSQLLHLPKLS